MLSLDRRIGRPYTSTEEKDSAAMASLLMDDRIMLLLLFLIEMSVLMMIEMKIVDWITTADIEWVSEQNALYVHVNVTSIKVHLH